MVWDRRRSRFGVAVVAVCAAPFVTGCGTTLIGGDSQSVLDILSNYGITEDATLADALNQITVGDVVSAFADFTDQAAAGAGAHVGHSITNDELAQIESLQLELDAGEITEAEFSNAARDIISDRGAGVPFAGFSFYGSPFRHHAGPTGAAALELSDEQQQATEANFETLHDDIDALREAAHQDIRAILSDEQVAILDEKFGDSTSRQRRVHASFGRRGGFGFGEPISFSSGGDRFAEELELTDEQQEAIDDIRTSLREAIQARHEQARADFLALLTDEQLDTLGLPDADTDIAEGE